MLRKVLRLPRLNIWFGASLSLAIEKISYKLLNMVPSALNIRAFRVVQIPFDLQRDLVGRNQMEGFGMPLKTISSLLFGFGHRTWYTLLASYLLTG